MLTLQAKIVDGEKQQVVYFNAQRWYSPSNSYIHIIHDDSKPVKCKVWQQFEVLYTLNDTFVNNTITFHYLVMKITLVIYLSLHIFFCRL